MCVFQGSFCARNAALNRECICLGGSNDGEHWGAPNAMGSQLNADTEESCTQYVRA